MKILSTVMKVMAMMAGLVVSYLGGYYTTELLWKAIDKTEED